MKFFLLPSGIISLLLLTGCGQQASKPNSEKVLNRITENLQGKVKHVKEFNFDINDTLSFPDLSSVPIQIDYYFDEKGNLIKIEKALNSGSYTIEYTFNDNNNILSEKSTLNNAVTEYVYDDSGMIIKETYSNKDGISSTKNAQWDASKSRWVETITSNTAPGATNSVETTIDSSNHTKKIQTILDGKMLNVTKFYFSNDWKDCIKTETMDEKGENILLSTIYTYTATHQPLTSKHKDVGSETYSGFFYEYDPFGNAIKDGMILHDSMIVYRSIYYQYDSKGNWVKKISGDKNLDRNISCERIVEYY